jgi:hypothetical protein
VVCLVTGENLPFAGLLRTDLGRAPIGDGRAGGQQAAPGIAEACLEQRSQATGTVLCLRMAVADLQDCQAIDATGLELVETAMKLGELLERRAGDASSTNQRRRACEGRLVHILRGCGGRPSRYCPQTCEKKCGRRSAGFAHASGQRTTVSAACGAMALKRGETSSSLLKVMWPSNS